MDRENFINAVLKSTNGMTLVTPPEDLYLKIETRINNKEVVSLNTLWMVAASVVVLITINFLLMNDFRKSASPEMIVLEQTINPTNQLY